MGVRRVQVKSWCRRFGAKGGNNVNHTACLLVLGRGVGRCSSLSVHWGSPQLPCAVLWLYGL